MNRRSLLRSALVGMMLPLMPLADRVAAERKQDETEQDDTLPYLIFVHPDAEKLLRSMPGFGIGLNSRPEYKTAQQIKNQQLRERMDSMRTLRIHTPWPSR